MPSVRTQLANALRPHLPAAWKFISSERNVDRLQTTCVLLRQREIRRSPAAPIGAHVVEFLMTVVDPREDREAAESPLDDSIDTVLHVLDSALGLTWTDAKKALFQERYLCYDITLEVTSKKE